MPESTSSLPSNWATPLAMLREQLVAPAPQWN